MVVEVVTSEQGLFRMGLQYSFGKVEDGVEPCMQRMPGAMMDGNGWLSVKNGDVMLPNGEVRLVAAGVDAQGGTGQYSISHVSDVVRWGSCEKSRTDVVAVEAQGVPLMTVWNSGSGRIWENTIQQIRMESPESSYVSSPEIPPKRAGPPKSPTRDDKERVTYIRFLVSNSAAGSVIGKGGSTITEFQSQSGARIQLSRNHEFVPGTSDRIIIISGTINEILNAMELILAKLLSEVHAEDGDVDPISKVRLIVPNSSCGGIIGKGGATIKSFIEDSHAAIKISPQDHNYIGLNDRLVMLTGSLEEQMRAFFLILTKLTEDVHYSQSGVLGRGCEHGNVRPKTAKKSFRQVIERYHSQMTLDFHTNNKILEEVAIIPSMCLRPQDRWILYPSHEANPERPRVNFSGFHGIPYAYVLPHVGTVAYNTINYGPHDAGGKFQNDKDEQGNSVTIGVADEHIGVVVGHGGRNIMEISQVTGARIKISDRGDFLSCTSDRKVTRRVTGSNPYA
ncbi:hypothetical protein NE237_004950 [Protea cynaroides]|uniref:K Homology domain-containing protein n=1 Tax=Protea cynaroides TaxID=273540 RepID=A0A9Q0KKC4_9MAGN|nr:hypothetical protein NE237_004950 [Protea cynaroides]